MKNPPRPLEAPGIDPLQALRRAVQFHQQGRLDQAEPLYRAILDAQPNSFDANYLFGVLRVQQGRNHEALDLVGAALKANSHSASAHATLGTALERLGRLEAALASYNQAVAIKPDYVQALFDRANVLIALQRPEAALASFDRAVALAPNHAEALNNRGLALLAVKRPEAALASFDRALKIKPGFVAALNNRAVALLALKRPDAALASLDQALASGHESLDGLNNRALALTRLKRPLAALASYERALAQAPANAEALDGKAALLVELGRFAEARETIDAAIALAPRRARPYFNLTQLPGVASDDARLQAMEDLARDMSSLAASEQIDLNFALAKVYADRADYERSFRRLAQGNAVKREATGYDETAALGLFRRVGEVFTGEAMRALEGAGDTSTTPVFILGMPRSGTTLVEQILASHPKVFGAGELDDFEERSPTSGAKSGASLNFPEMFAAATGEDMRRLGAIYLQRIGAAASRAKQVTDKRRGTSSALVSSIAPYPTHASSTRAAIRSTPAFLLLATVRLEPALCLQPWRTRSMLSCLRSADVALARSVAAGAMLEVQYEEVVADLEGQARRIVAYCGLEWDARCLDFHRTERQVRTASVSQVRQPIYKSSVGRSRAYKAFLGPLREALKTDLLAGPP